jgi:hypothetical protein
MLPSRVQLVKRKTAQVLGLLEELAPLFAASSSSAQAN